MTPDSELSSDDTKGVRRPMLLVFGESLRSFGTESAFTSAENLTANVDGALLVGPTFVNPRHGPLTDDRHDGSSFWRPVVDGHRYGSNVVDGWVEISAPDGWTDADTEALRALIDQRAEERTARKEAAG